MHAAFDHPVIMPSTKHCPKLQLTIELVGRDKLEIYALKVSDDYICRLI